MGSQEPYRSYRHLTESFIVLNSSKKCPAWGLRRYGASVGDRGHPLHAVKADKDLQMKQFQRLPNSMRAEWPSTLATIKVTADGDYYGIPLEDGPYAIERWATATTIGELRKVLLQIEQRGEEVVVKLTVRGHFALIGLSRFTPVLSAQAI